MNSTDLIFEKSQVGRCGSSLPKLDVPDRHAISHTLQRSTEVSFPEVSELDTVRHFTNLSRKNIAIDTCFYPLGSCTMKYNPKLHEHIAALEGLKDLHPLFAQLRGFGTLTQGGLAVLYQFEILLCELLGFEQFTMQPLAGSHGELTGVMMIAAYHHKNGQTRNTILIPDGAHGTNPATASLAGFQTKELPSDKHGNVDMLALKNSLDDTIAGIMLTCPNTLGLFDPNVEEICRLVHEAGGLCYGDGANLNAILARIRPGDLGFDAMHVNLHKTFTTPHGGGGPGAGIVGVSKKLLPFLPKARIMKADDGSYYLNYDLKDSIGYIAPFYGNFGMIVRAYAYALTLGRNGFVRVAENAVINANYLRVKLSPYFDLPFDRVCMHECVLSAQNHKKKGVTALDIAKALLDKNFHPPTIYFPLIVAEALMIEPTETESKQTLDAFIEAMVEIIKEIDTKVHNFESYPRNYAVTRLDEGRAARNPDLANLG